MSKQVSYETALSHYVAGKEELDRLANKTTPLKRLELFHTINAECGIYGNEPLMTQFFKDAHISTKKQPDVKAIWKCAAIWPQCIKQAEKIQAADTESVVPKRLADVVKKVTVHSQPKKVATIKSVIDDYTKAKEKRDAKRKATTGDPIKVLTTKLDSLRATYAKTWAGFDDVQRAIDAMHEVSENTTPAPAVDLASLTPEQLAALSQQVAELANINKADYNARISANLKRDAA